MYCAQKYNTFHSVHQKSVLCTETEQFPDGTSESVLCTETQQFPVGISEMFTVHRNRILSRRHIGQYLPKKKIRTKLADIQWLKYTNIGT